MNRIPPKVSVCIPVYNGGVYIAESIESVLGQTFKDLSLIVCDNCSTDNTEEIVQSFHDPRLTYIRNEKNLGLVGNANRCLSLAEGEYICIFHHDDVMMPENLERKVRILDDNPEVGFVHSNIKLIDSKGEVIAENMWVTDSTQDYIEYGIKVFQRFVDYLPFGASIFIGAVLARRECYDRLGGFSSELPHCNDSEMWMRMSLFYNVACIGIPLVKYRVHPMSTSSGWGDWKSTTYLKEHYLAVMIVFQGYKEKIPEPRRFRRQVSLSFGKQALMLSCNAFGNGEFASGRDLFKEAIRLSPQIFTTLLFWKAAAMLIAGSSGVRFYQSFKKWFKQ
jgi:glycosyltransferase involved in cell wall biosynthesis